MERSRGPKPSLTLGFEFGLYLAIIMDSYGGPQTALNIALHGGLYLAIIRDVMKGTSLSLL
jgi:hypothetical protein